MGNGGEEGVQRLIQGVRVVSFEGGEDPVLGALPLPAVRQVPAQDRQRQACPYLAVGETEPVSGQTRRSADLLADGGIAGLKKQGLGLDLIDVEAAEQVIIGVEEVEIRDREAPPQQQVDQKARRAGLEPVGAKLTLTQEQQYITKGCRPADPVKL